MEMAEVSVQVGVPEERQIYLETDNDRIVMIILMVVLPPMAVFFKCRGCTKHVCINLLLYLLLVLPAYKHATWFCFVKGREHEAENGFVRVR
ncbi:Protein CBG11423 [Caenorhabditis briggsae]|uniref:Transmembrane protein n=4 Tax=Caenorhabditis TaxID=6237 RepID=A0AAE9EU75_CAEBR|nr:Protein CBG11423 [Caenorhabditis briggsae]PIC22323.1 hypothetical protein B9Z55_016422 [Caenorhabditis nigoni]ULT85900.1 hypothetical protein L3Y34_005946 [Caenorhabditis briggsae]UMM31654.1 hypothetical protein L5515_005765 [Caenorhabditis briggsae]CAP30539.1 Protein CBG11423 [Caenorhabditis briggsae]